MASVVGCAATQTWPALDDGVGNANNFAWCGPNGDAAFSPGHSSDLVCCAVADAISGLFSSSSLESNPILALRPISVPSDVCHILPHWKQDLQILEENFGLDFVGVTSEGNDILESVIVPGSQKIDSSSASSRSGGASSGIVLAAESHPVEPFDAGHEGESPSSIVLCDEDKVNPLVYGEASLLKALKKLNVSICEQKQFEKINTLGSQHKNSLPLLVTEKRKVKEELKKYDVSFKSIFGDIPTKKEKEPLRPLYAYYKRIRSFLIKRERQQSASMVVRASSVPAMSRSTALANTSLSTAIPKNCASLGLLSALDNDDMNLVSPAGLSLPSVAAIQKSTNNKSGKWPDLATSKEDQQGHVPGSLMWCGKRFPTSSSNSSTSSPSPSISYINSLNTTEDLTEDLRRLHKLEELKAHVASCLKQYQDLFFKAHGRKIIFHKDIVPVEGDYKKYKLLREQVNKLSESIRKRQETPI